MNSIDYGLIALFALQGVILVGVAWLFARLTNKMERLTEAETAYKHLSETLRTDVDKLGKSYDTHKAKVKDLLAEKLDFEKGDDKLRSELRSLNSRFSILKKRIEEDVEEEPEIQPETIEPLSKGGAPPADNQINFPGFGEVM